MSLEGLLRNFLNSQLDRCLPYVAQQTILGNTLDSDQRHASLWSLTLRDHVCPSGQNAHSVVALGCTHARHSESAAFGLNGAVQNKL